MNEVMSIEKTIKSANWTEADLQLMKDTVAKGTSDQEFKLFLFTAARLQLNPLVGQIWCVKYGNNPASIFTGRDGFLSIAHRSGQFDGMESGTKLVDGELYGWCRVYRKDMAHPFAVEVALSEYSTGRNLWKDKPRTMIQKVAESQALRRAFDISGLYSPEEIETEQPPEEPKNITPKQVFSNKRQAAKKQPQPSKQQKAPKSEYTEEFVRLLNELADTIKTCGVDPADEAARTELFRKVGGEPINPKDMTRDQVLDLNARLIAYLELPAEIPDAAEEIAARNPFR